MLTRISTQSGLLRSILGTTSILVGSLGVVLSVLGVSIAFEVSVATARTDIAFAQQTVNRTRKADRLVSAFTLRTVNQVLDIQVSRTPVLGSKLADGCEPLVSPLADSLFARVAGRCVS